VTAAALDPRINAVCACIATPDWMRHGSVEDQGSEDEHSRLMLERLNPIDHPERFQHKPWIRFDNAAEDVQVPPEAACRFQRLLLETHYSGHPDRIEVFEQAGIGHTFSEEMWTRTLSWLSRFRSDEIPDDFQLGQS
jgi:hypothetical protein